MRGHIFHQDFEILTKRENISENMNHTVMQHNVHTANKVHA